MVGKPPQAPLPSGEGLRIAVVCARYHQELSDLLLSGALEVLRQAGVGEGDVEVFLVPGSFEIPWAVKEVILRLRPHGVIALGIVIRGETPHFHYVSRAATEGVMRVALETRTPVTMGILTCDTREQAEARCGGKEGNKGGEAALALLQLISELRRLPHP